MNLVKKWLTMPFSNRLKKVEVVQLWEVRWWARHGNFDEDEAEYVTAKPQVECFTSEVLANDFKQSLDNAFALLRYTGSGRKVTMERAS